MKEISEDKNILTTIFFRIFRHKILHFFNTFCRVYPKPKHTQKSSRRQ